VADVDLGVKAVSVYSKVFGLIQKSLITALGLLDMANDSKYRLINISPLGFE
jgi:hypothetical protein